MLRLLVVALLASCALSAPCPCQYVSRATPSSTRGSGWEIENMYGAPKYTSSVCADKADISWAPASDNTVENVTFQFAMPDSPEELRLWLPNGANVNFRIQLPDGTEVGSHVSTNNCSVCGEYLVPLKPVPMGSSLTIVIDQSCGFFEISAIQSLATYCCPPSSATGTTSTTSSSTTGASSTTSSSTTGASSTTSSSTTGASSTTSSSTTGASSTTSSSTTGASSTTSSSTTGASSTTSSSTTGASSTTSSSTTGASSTTSSSTTGTAPSPSAAAASPSPSAAGGCATPDAVCTKDCIFIQPSKVPNPTKAPKPSKDPNPTKYVEPEYYTIQATFPCSGVPAYDCCDFYDALPDASSSDWLLCGPDSAEGRKPSYDEKNGECTIFMYAQAGTNGIDDAAFQAAQDSVEMTLCGDSTASACEIKSKEGQSLSAIYKGSASAIAVSAVLLSCVLAMLL